MRQIPSRIVGVLAVASLLAASGAGAAPRLRLPQVKADANGQVKAAAIYNPNTVYDPTSYKEEYHAKINDPSVPDSVKCELRLRHGELAADGSVSGGTLGGTVESAHSTMFATLNCRSAAVYTFKFPAVFEVHTGPHSDDAENQTFETNMYYLEGSAKNEIFSSLHLVAGTGNGFPSPGRTSLISNGDGTFSIDSTFNIGYRIDFVGAKGGPLDGAAGSITSSIQMKAFSK